ncbi:MAG: hypothetical protein ACRCZM_11500 [Bacteroidales bacterium]
MSNNEDIEKVNKYIGIYIRIRKDKPFDRELFNALITEIINIISIWTGETFVGIQKEKVQEKLFNQFFYSIKELIIFLENLGSTSQSESEFISHIKYTGNIFRYMGNGCFLSKATIIPTFNDVYVSWSKNYKSVYLESKLYGPVTYLQCNIQGDDFGLDLEGFDKFVRENEISNFNFIRPNEREVVFPMSSKIQIDVEYRLGDVHE